MLKNHSNSSFSSFSNDWENQPQFQQTKFDKKTKNKIVSHKGILKTCKNDTLVFSEFEEEAFENKFQTIAKENKIIKRLKEQIQRLKKQNHKLANTNMQLLDDIQKIKQINMRLQEKLVMKGYEQLKSAGKKQKIQTLIQEIDQVKYNMNKLRAQSQKDKLQIASLKSQLFCYQQMEVEWTWKQKFIELFVDMLDKITTGIDLKWTTKKKIQVGWKVVKNLVHKALSAGIRPPRVERNRQ